MNLFISPHSDDATLFGAFTLMREHPLVLTLTDSFVQQNRGDNITPDERREEDIEAMKILGCPIVFGGIRDDIMDEWLIDSVLCRFKNFDLVYIPAVIVPGNNQHNMIGKIAETYFPNIKKYMTYSTNKLYMEGTEKVTGDFELKEKALACYKSQINLPATAPHFEAIKGKPEWFI